MVVELLRFIRFYCCYFCTFQVFAEWNVESEHVQGLLAQLRLVLADSSEPVQSHYGALVIFQALGYPVVSEYLAPILHNYLPRLQTMISECPLSNPRLAQHLQEIRGVILVSTSPCRPFFLQD